MKFLRFLFFLLIVCTSTSFSFSSTIDESTKRSIYEIISPDLGTSGTGFVISDSLLGKFLVTCKHVVQDASGNYVDSILVRRNKLLPTGQAVSDTSRFVLRLKVDGRKYFAEHPNPGVDLIIIPFLADFNTTISPNEPLYGQYSYVVLTKDIMHSLGIDEGTDVEVIGFSLSLPDGNIHYHFSRFGKVGLYATNEFTLIIEGRPRTANYVLLDMTVRPGNSGSPIFGHINNNTYLIGFLSAYSSVMEYGIGYPVYYLYDLMTILKNEINTTTGPAKK